MDNAETSARLEVLFREESWLQALARSLVRDNAAAQDLIQDVWTAALENPPEDTSRPRAWLSTVARRLASKRKARLKPALVDGLEAVPSDLEGPQWVAIRFETRGQLRAAVERLEEPIRTVILLRFQEGLPLKDAATRMGLSQRWLRTLTGRGLDRIRDELERESGTRGTEAAPAWAVMLAPLLAPEDLPLRTAPPATAPSGPRPLGGVGLVAAVGVGLLGLGVLVHRLTGASSPLETGSPPEAVPDRVGPRTAAVLEAGDERATSTRTRALGGHAGRSRDGDPTAKEQAPPGDTAPSVGLEPPATSETYLFSGRLTIDQAPPENFELLVYPPLGGDPLLLDEEGRFQVPLPEPGMWELRLLESFSPEASMTGARDGQPRFYTTWHVAEGDGERHLDLDVRTGDVVLAGATPDLGALTLHLAEAEWEYWSDDMASSKQGEDLELVQVPEGTVDLLHHDKSLWMELEVEVDQVLTLDLKTGERTYSPRE